MPFKDYLPSTWTTASRSSSPQQDVYDIPEAPLKQEEKEKQERLIRSLKGSVSRRRSTSLPILAAMAVSALVMSIYDMVHRGVFWTSLLIFAPLCATFSGGAYAWWKELPLALAIFASAMAAEDMCLGTYALVELCLRKWDRLLYSVLTLLPMLMLTSFSISGWQMYRDIAKMDGDEEETSSGSGDDPSGASDQGSRRTSGTEASAGGRVWGWVPSFMSGRRAPAPVPVPDKRGRPGLRR